MNVVKDGGEAVDAEDDCGWLGGEARNMPIHSNEEAVISEVLP